MLRIGLSVIALVGCAAPAAAPPGAAPSPAVAEASPVIAPDAPLGEAEARARIGSALRAAGYRVVADVAVSAGDAALVLDGWDPERRAGFEYVADFAGDSTVTPAAAAALASAAPGGLLIVAAASAEAVDAAVAGFVVAHPPATVPR